MLNCQAKVLLCLRCLVANDRSTGQSPDIGQMALKTSDSPIYKYQCSSLLHNME